MDVNNLVFLPSFSLKPQSLTIFNSVFKKIKNDTELVPIQQKNTHEYQTASTVIPHQIPNIQNKLFSVTPAGDFDYQSNQTISKIEKSNQTIKLESINKNSTVKRSHHNFTISENANRTLRNKINWLYYLSKSKQIKTYNGKSIFNFKIGFITLTLPSKQQHPTNYITKELLNTFLTEIRQRTKMENYVWRLEFQSNGNVHYHLVTDTYIDYHLCQKVWNKILAYHGYIQPYSDKMNKLSLTDYNNLYNKNSKIEYPEIVKRYARGKRENWQNPNSVDVKPVISNKAIANYISKYFSKESKSGVNKNELDNDDNSKSMRLWFCSRSLSKLKSVSNFVDAVEYDIESLMSYCSEKRTVFLKYTKVIYYNLKAFTHDARRWIETILRNYAYKTDYRPASG